MTLQVAFYTTFLAACARITPPANTTEYSPATAAPDSSRYKFPAGNISCCASHVLTLAVVVVVIAVAVAAAAFHPT